MKLETTNQFAKRKINEAASILYRSIAFPFVKMKIEHKSNSIICKNAYLRDSCSLDGMDYIGENTQLENVHIGKCVYIGRDARISNTIIGNYSCVGNIQTYIGKHPIKGENISIHPAFYSTAKQYGFTYVNEQSFQEDTWLDSKKRIQINIGNDTWIGYGVCILSGVTIGDGAIVGANSLVTKDIEPYAIYAGIPAKKIGMRFDDDTINKLLKLRWWDKDDAWIEQNAKQFKNPRSFFDNISN